MYKNSNKPYKKRFFWVVDLKISQKLINLPPNKVQEEFLKIKKRPPCIRNFRVVWYDTFP